MLPAPAPFEPALRKILGEDAAHLTVWRHPEGFDPAVLTDTDFLVLCKEAAHVDRHVAGAQGKTWHDASAEYAIREWVAKGGTLLGWHSGVAGYQEDGVQGLFGGTFRGHPPIHPFVVRVANAADPLVAGVSQFSVVDEQYRFPFNDGFSPKLLLESESEEHGRQPIAWSHPFERGHVLVYLLGHIAPTVNERSSLRFLANIVAFARSRST